MKQGIFVILLIATISVVGYALYQSYPGRMTELLDIRASQPTPQPATPTTPVFTTQPTVVIIVPTTHSGPTKLPVTGALDAQYVWSDSPMVALLIGLIITSTTAFWLGRRH